MHFNSLLLEARSVFFRNTFCENLRFFFCKKVRGVCTKIAYTPSKTLATIKRGGGGGEWQAVVTGIKDLSKFIFTGSNISMIVYEGGLFSWKKVFFFGKGSFLRSRGISMEEGFFYSRGVFLPRRLIFKAEAYFFRGSVFLQRRLISTAEAYFHGESLFYKGETYAISIEIHLQRRLTSSKMSI